MGACPHTLATLFSFFKKSRRGYRAKRGGGGYSHLSSLSILSEAIVVKVWLCMNKGCCWTIPRTRGGVYRAWALLGPMDAAKMPQDRIAGLCERRSSSCLAHRIDIEKFVK